MNPASKDHLSEKFRGMSRLVMSEPESLELESMLWGLATLESLHGLSRLYRALKPS